MFICVISLVCWLASWNGAYLECSSPPFLLGFCFGFEPCGDLPTSPCLCWRHLSWCYPCGLACEVLSLEEAFVFMVKTSLGKALVFYGVLSLEEVLVFIVKSSLLMYLLCSWLRPLSWGDSCVDLVEDLPCVKSLVSLVVSTFWLSHILCWVDLVLK